MTAIDRPQGPALTYSEVGATARVLPAGYHHSHYRRVVGQGRESFDQAVAALLSWQVHRRAGLRIEADTPPVEVGMDLRMRLGAGRVALVIPCRVVYLIGGVPGEAAAASDDGGGPGPERRGFAYGTLPGHPETGEESFVLELAGDGTVVFEMAAFSNAARWYTRAAGPVARIVQKIALRRYAWACARCARLS